MRTSKNSASANYTLLLHISSHIMQIVFYPIFLENLCSEHVLTISILRSKKYYFDNLHVIRETVPLNPSLIVLISFIQNFSSRKIKYLSTNHVIIVCFYNVSRSMERTSLYIYATDLKWMVSCMPILSHLRNSPSSWYNAALFSRLKDDNTWRASQINVFTRGKSTKGRDFRSRKSVQAHSIMYHHITHH